MEINEIMNAIRRRHRSLYPDWEVLYLSFSKHDPAENNNCLIT